MDNKVRDSAVFDSFVHSFLLNLNSFTGSAGVAIVSKTAAYLIADARYWLQAENELDDNWHVIRMGSEFGPRNWVDWVSVRAPQYSILCLRLTLFPSPFRTESMSQELELMRAWSPMRPHNNFTLCCKPKNPSLFTPRRTWST